MNPVIINFVSILLSVVSCFLMVDLALEGKDNKLIVLVAAVAFCINLYYLVSRLAELL